MKAVEVDMDKLYQIFKERELKITSVAKDIGVNNGYFSNAKTRGTMSELVITALEVHYNIPRAKYVIVHKKEKPEVEQDRLFTEKDKVALYELIYSAVYKAMKKALNE